MHSHQAAHEISSYLSCLARDFAPELFVVHGETWARYARAADRAEIAADIDKRTAEARRECAASAPSLRPAPSPTQAMGSRQGSAAAVDKSPPFSGLVAGDASQPYPLRSTAAARSRAAPEELRVRVDAAYAAIAAERQADVDAGWAAIVATINRDAGLGAPVPAARPAVPAGAYMVSHMGEAITAQRQAGIDAGWAAIMETLNESVANSPLNSFATPTPGDSPAVNPVRRDRQQQATDWPEIAGRLNTEHGVSAPARRRAPLEGAP